MDEARQIAAGLSDSAAGCHEDMFFVDAESGTYGYLALWDTGIQAQEFAQGPAVQKTVETLTRRLEKPPALRQYTVERPKEYR